MISKYYNTAKGFWFVMEIILIFISVEAIAYAIGYYDVATIALVLLGAATLIFIAALFIAVKKDKKHKNGFAV